MMTQGELSFKYEEEGQGVGMTAIAGIAPYLDLACRSGMVRSIERNVRAREGGQGWTDGKMVLSLIVANMDWEGGDLIEWHYKRCGKSEEAHSVMKEDLGRGEVAQWWIWQ